MAANPMMSNLSGAVNTQISLVSQIPSKVFAAYPAWIGFAIVDNIQGMIMSAIPDVGTGLAGRAYGSIVRGFAKTVQFVTWDTLRSASY